MARPCRQGWRFWVVVSTISCAGELAGSVQAADALAGKARAAVCVDCHGRRGEGSVVNPPLAGLPERRLIQALRGYRRGEGRAAAMHIIAKVLSDEDIANLAAYYSGLK